MNANTSSKPKVLLMAPPYLELYGKIKHAAGKYFPLGLGYLAAFLRKYGDFEVQMVEPEAQRLSYQDLALIIRREKPDFVGITSATPNFYDAMALAQLVKSNSNAIVIIGGVHVTAVKRFVIECYSDRIDYLVVGEGEQTFLALLEGLLNKRDIRQIPGLLFKDGQKIVDTGIRPFIEALDEIPFPARDLIPQRLFTPNLHNARYPNCATILTSRGCPYNCSFCAARLVSGRKYRTHSPDYVLAEMEQLKKDYGIRQLLITDDTFTINRERLFEICTRMIKRRLNFKWFCFSQVNTIDAESIKLMKRAGCYSIGFGVESADEKILRQMGKPIHPGKAIETIRAANKIGIKTQAFYIFGTKGETEASMVKTIRYAERVNATLAFFNMLVPYPGTRDFQTFFENIPLNQINWKDFVAIGEECVLKSSVVPPQRIKALIAEANVRYYRHPKRLWQIMKHIRTPYELSNYLRGGVSLMQQIIRWRPKG